MTDESDSPRPVALVTGTRSGIGRATAAALRDAGYRVVGTRSWGEATADEVVMDVADDDSVRAGVEAVLERSGGRLDVVVNNAGIAMSGSLETSDWATARHLFEVNVWGPVRVLRATLPVLRASIGERDTAGDGDRPHPVVVNVSSVGGRAPARGYQAFYAASKHALRAMTEALAWELGPFGIRVLLAEPGFVATEIFDRARFEIPPDPADPYGADEQWVRSFFLRGSASALDPAVVGARLAELVDAARRAPVPLYQPVGPDAEAGIAAARAAPDFETWLAGALARIDALVGPRPGTPA